MTGHGATAEQSSLREAASPQRCPKEKLAESRSTPTKTSRRQTAQQTQRVGGDEVAGQTRAKRTRVRFGDSRPKLAGCLVAPGQRDVAGSGTAAHAPPPPTKPAQTRVVRSPPAGDNCSLAPAFAKLAKIQGRLAGPASSKLLSNRSGRPQKRTLRIFEEARRARPTSGPNQPSGSQHGLVA